MVVLKGPCHSFAASGTLGGAITFATIGGTAYARRPVQPPDPETPAQIANRRILSFLAETWRTLAPSVQLLWNHAHRNRPRGYQGYVAQNIERWWRREFPEDRPFPTLIAAPSSAVSTRTVSGSVLKCSITAGAVPPNWGYAVLYRELIQPNIDPTYLVALLDNVGPITFNLKLKHHVSGYINIIAFHDCGVRQSSVANYPVSNP
jgi:hypothetical protein